MNQRKPRSLASRIFWLYGLSILMAATISLVLLIRQEFVQHIADSVKSAKKMADLSLHSVSESALIGDFDTIHRTLKSMVPDSPLREAVYQGATGGTLQVGQKSESSAPAWVVAVVSSQLPDVTREVSIGGVKYGDLTLRFDVNEIASNLWTLVLKVLGLAFLAVVVGLRLMHFLLLRGLGKLDLLQSYEKEILAGSVNAELQFSEDTPLEIRNTLEVINRTADSLRVQFGQRIESLMDSLILHKNAMDEAAIVCELDTEGRLTYANDSFVAAIGLSRETLLNRRLVDIGSINLTAFDYWTPSPDIWHGEVLFESANGQQRWLRRSIVPNSGSDGQVDRYICIDIDISEQKQSETDLRDQVRRQKLITEFGGLALVTQDCSQLDSEVVQMVCTGLQASHAALIVQPPGDARQRVVAVAGWAQDWVGHSLPDQPPGSNTSAGPLLEVLRQARVLEVQAQANDESRLSLVVADQRPLEFTQSDQNFLRSLLYVLDAALERSRARELLLYMAQFDGLTGLPNRAMLLDRLEMALQTVRRDGTRLGVMYVDFDRFKLVNDTLGHQAGDMLLVQAAQRMTACLRAGDTVARLSGDEFVILLSELNETADAGLVGRKVLAQLNQPFYLQGQEAFISASVGASVYPEDGQDAPTLLRHADQAMYYAKEMGRNAFHYYDKEMGQRISGLQMLEKQLQGALERQEFFLLYQPKVSLRHGGISGFEALLRWRHPQRGVVGPDEFVSVLEETGMIVLVGEWVLRRVAEQVVNWQAEGLTVPRVAINLSARQFSSEQLEATVEDVLRQSRVDPKLLEFELTESMLMQDPDAALEMIEKFHRYGLSFSIDDFGTGYSSLSLLNRFPLDAIKIDRSFVRNMAQDAGNAAITRGIITLAHSLQLKVVAEGVETLDQLNMLSDWACDEIQGYYFSEPVTAADCAAMLTAKKRLVRPLQLEPVASIEYLI
jgi:diguanylate cyclase (GGDEF)-like protein/PAS domain S-box-containing protein